ncbi:MAG TPA: gliding motility-associated C-terminal domain-containing protein [Hanamia sp.]|nr:gliding motility-associated C-terminal domain-containing protein [Hanamia sp.]
MYVKLLILFFTFLLSGFLGKTQTCTTLGQTPSTAFPVCGTGVFEQNNVPICASNDLYVPGCSGTGNANYANKNPYWYKFTCFVSGTLGFVITPKDLKDDYDWQLYDVTGLNPNEVFTNRGIIITGNWAGNPGTTGTSASGVSYIQCASSYNGTEPRFAKMPDLIAGHEYILLVSHFTDSQSGYGLSFGGGTAVITDPKLPDLQSVHSSCDASQLFIKLNKKIRCSSLASDGSDFIISSASTGVIAATGINCNQGFDMDSLVLNLKNPLPAGDYNVTIKKGTDGNTLVDNCDRSIDEGKLLSFTILPLLPTPMDSLTPAKCAPQTLQLVFKKNILCNSISADGSDFIITGPSPVTVSGASGSCVNGLTSIINITLSAPVVNAGTYKISLKQGSLGNTIIDECGQETPAGSSISFSVKDTVSADFTSEIGYGCKTDTVNLQHDGRNGVDQWNWKWDPVGHSTSQNPVAYFNSFGTKQVELIVSNGFCSDTVRQSIILDNELKASFETNNIICPEDSAQFINKSIGDIVSYNWEFNNGNRSDSEIPSAQKYPLLTFEKLYDIRLIVKNNQCADTAFQKIKVLKSCYIAVPNAFTPNGDGLNDYLYPLNAFKADNLEFKVYNRLGQLVYSSKDWTQKWDGTVKGEPQDSGTFVWTLQYTHHDTGKKVFMKGSTVLIR